ncbi:MAG TPA: cyclic nucleotide-binding domain-containing protein [Kofleriaceae bacterium]|nr:cyclic nucleotide-binding domain-containing protein [Kofleriaceae bacterium]
MARDARQLRQEAADAATAGKYKRALAAYLELETLESRDAQWPKRAGETYRRLNRDKDAIEAFTRAADRYAQGGFLVQAIAVCKLILQIDPRNDTALQRIAAMNEQIGAGPTRAGSIADNNPNLADNAAVSALRTRNNTAIPLDVDEPRRRKISSSPPLSIPRTRTPPSSIAIQISDLESDGDEPPRAAPARTTTPIGLSLPRTKTSNAQSQLAMARTKSKPITLPPDMGIDAIDLKTEIPEAFEREDNSGVYVIPIDDEDYLDEPTSENAPLIVVEEPSSIEVEAVDVEESTELELADLEEIPIAEPRALGLAAAETLASTPLFSGMSQEALEALVAELTLVHLVKDEALFHEGDPGDALYVIVEGELSVQAEGPPRVEMARLGPGAFLGEVALMTDQPRSATVTALGDAELLRIDRATLAHVLAEHGDILTSVLRFVRERLVDRWTRTSALFRPFNPQERAALASRFKFLEIEANRTLLAAGHRPDGLYIVLAGHFSVTRAGAIVATLGPGDLIGEAALLSGGVFQSEVRARGKSLALCLPANDFREMIMTHPHVLEYIGEQAEQSRKLQIL